MLDPFTSLSLAGNIVQFIDYTARLLSSSYEIYNSATGLPQEFTHLEGVTTRLLDLGQALSDGTNPLGLNSKTYEHSLDELRRKCAEDAKTLVDSIVAIRGKEKKDGEKSKWASFRTALKAIWKKDEIERLERRINGYRGEISTLLVAMLSDKTSSVVSTLDKLVEENRKADMQRSEQLAEIKSQIDKLGRTGYEVSQYDFDKLQDSLLKAARTGQDIMIEQSILKSLRFREIKVRFEKISEAHKNTLQWLLQHHEADQPIRFMEWLEDPSVDSQRIYWIGVKAGSGKSTLMKFICDHKKTLAALRKWAGDQPLATASFFFWAYGTSMQKSQEGLLQTLLHEILRKCPGLIQRCLPHRWTFESQESWSRTELLEAFASLNDGLESTRFCLFIDGLDEYDGDPRDLLPVIQNLSTSPNVKICASSRPWQIFKDTFDKNVHQRLYLQDLTKADIQAFVRSNFEADENFLQAKEEDSGYEQLVDEVVERAQGVFLWVSLVTKSLLNKFTYGDSLRTLQMRLQHLPLDLEEFFQHMLDTVEPVYQTQMAKTFLIALAAEKPQPLMLYSFLDDIAEDPQFALDLNGHVLSKCAEKPPGIAALKAMTKREIRMQKRLDARTKGLLEVAARGTAKYWMHNKVDFLHRSVGDFLNRKETKARFIEAAGPTFNADFVLCHAFLAAVKFASSRTTSKLQQEFSNLEIMIHEVLAYAKKCESENEVAHTSVLDEPERFLCAAHPSMAGPISVSSFRLKKHSLKVDNLVLRRSQAHTVLELTVQHGLYLYLEKRLSMDPTLVSSKQWHRPLLSHALFPVRLAEFHHRRYHPRHSRTLSIVRLLFDHGADANAVDGESSIWQKYVQDMMTNPSMSKLDMMDALLSGGTARGGGGGCTGNGRVLLETLTIASASPAKPYQTAMVDKLFEFKADPNARYDDSTVWKRYMAYLQHGKTGSFVRIGLQDEFKYVKQLLEAGADPAVIIGGKSVDEIFRDIFDGGDLQVLLSLVEKLRAQKGTEGGFLKRLWKW